MSEQCWDWACEAVATETDPIRGVPRPFCTSHARQRRSGIQRPVILKGSPFDVGECRRTAPLVVGEGGEINWKAAAAADPGVMTCPACEVYHWNEGVRVKCAMPDCGHEWTVP